MQLYHVLSILAAGVISHPSTASNSTSHHPPATWKRCPGFTFDAGGESDVPNFDAECLVFTAPTCHPGICEAPRASKPNIDVFVKRVAAVGSNAKKAVNVVLLPGGPGMSSVTTEPTLRDLHMRLGKIANVYLMEYRGIGRSTRLDCAAAKGLTTRSRGMEPSKVPSCAQELQTKYGNIAAFSTTSAAMDVASFIAQYTNGASTFVYGRGYGTMVAQRLMQLNPPTVTGYVLDSIMASSVAPDKKFYYSSRDTMFDEVGQRFMELCAKDSDCSSHFKDTSLSATLHDVLSKFDSNPKSTCAALVTEFTKKTPSIGLREQLGGLLANSAVRSMIPPLVYRFHRCDASDVGALAQFLQLNTEFVSKPDENDALESKVLADLVFYSEMWETPTPSLADLKTRFMTAGMSNQAVFDSFSTYCAFSKEQSPQCKEVGVGNYKANGITYPHDQYWEKTATVPSQASVLLMSGGLDPETPTKYAKFLFQALDTSKKELLVFDYAQTSLVSYTRFGNKNKMCGFELLVSFVTSNGDLSRLDKSCMAQMPAFDMAAPPDTVNYFFCTDDAYNGVPTTTEQNEGITPA